MKTLKTIQTLSKVGKVISRIIFIFCVIGGIGSIVGILGLSFIPNSLKIGGVTIHGMIEKSADISLGTCYTAMAIAVIFCAGEAVLSKFAELYFRHELEAGTPFSFDGAKEMLRLGILTICIPIGTTVIASIAYHIMSNAFGGVENMNLNDTISTGLGIMLIVISLLCKYGAELSQNSEQSKEEK